jgi:hypothetical protein
MSAKINSKVQRILDNYANIRDSYSNRNFVEGARGMDERLNEITDPGEKFIHELISLLFDSPILYMKVLLTFVFWKTMKKVEDTNVIHEFFENFKANDDENMNKSLGTFYNSENNNDQTVQILKEVGNTWYTTYFQVISVGNERFSLEEIQQRINLLVNIANYLMGDNVGTRALESCEIAAHSARSNEYVTFLGCVSELLGPDDPACRDPDIQKLIQEFNASLGRGGRK